MQWVGEGEIPVIARVVGKGAVGEGRKCTGHN